MELPGEKEIGQSAGYIKNIGIVGGAVLFVAGFFFVSDKDFRAHAEVDQQAQQQVLTGLQKLQTQVDIKEARDRERFTTNCAITAQGDSLVFNMCIKANQ